MNESQPYQVIDGLAGFFAKSIRATTVNQRLRSANRNRNLFLLFILFLFAPVTMAQHSHGQHEHSQELGEVEFKVSCKAEVQKQFNRAVALLHSFEYDEAEAAFTQVSNSDPDCAMAYWGIAMTRWHPLWAPPAPADLKAGLAAVEKAESLKAATERERNYIDAIKLFYKDADKLDHRTRALAYEKALEEMYARFPDDREAAIFYALALLTTALPTDKTYANQKKAGEILIKLLPGMPNHPGIVHYIIHAYDYPELASQSLAAAREYAKIAPASAHAQHMPSHIFTRLGFWEESIHSNLDSTASARAYAARNHIKGAWDEELHGMDYLMYAYLQTGQDQKARGVLEHLKAIEQVYPENFKVAYAFAAIPARFALERGLWSEAASLPVDPRKFPWSRFRQYESITVFARAVGAAHIGDLAAARKHIAEMASIRTALLEAKDNYWASQVEIQYTAAAAWLAYAEGKKQEAVKLLRAAADLEDSTEKHPVTPGAVLPAREMLGDLLLELNQPAEAFKQYELTLKSSPNRSRSLFGAGRAAELSGNNDKARIYYMKLLEVMKQAEGTKPEIEKAKKFLKKG